MQVLAETEELNKTSPIISLEQLSQIIGGQIRSGKPALPSLNIQNVHIQNTTIHSDLIKDGAAFFALTGQSDGHKYAQAALENGAVCAVVKNDHNPVDDQYKRQYIYVDDPLAAMQDLASWWRALLSAKVIAVIGSVGKTTTKDALVHFLGNAKMPVYGSPGSYNSQIGVALSCLQCPQDVEFAVIEASMTKPGEMKGLEKMVKPNYVVFTNILDRHTLNFSDEEHQRREFMSMAENLPDQGWMLKGWDCDDDHVRIDIQHQDRNTHCITIEHCEINVRTGSSWIVQDVALAVKAAYLLGFRQFPDVYRPNSSLIQSWTSRTGAVVVRASGVDSAIAWQAVLKDFQDSSKRLSILITQKLQDLSPSTLSGALVPLIKKKNLYQIFAEDYSADDVCTLTEMIDFENIKSISRVGALKETVLGKMNTDDVLIIMSSPSDMLEMTHENILEPIAPNRLYIDCGALQNNLNAFRAQLGADQKIMAVIKASAYGTSSLQMARALEKIGINGLVVSSLNEGIDLRRAGIKSEILSLLPTIDELSKIKRSDITPVAYSKEILNEILAMSDVKPNFHLEIDTGMHRTGIPFEEYKNTLNFIKTFGDIEGRLTGIMTHLSCADDPNHDEFTQLQLNRFQEIVDFAHKLGFENIMSHALATSGAIRFSDYKFDCARIGLGLFGVQPSEDCDQIKLENALSLTSSIVEIMHLKSGDRVGYGSKFIADRDMVAGLIPLGYHDGIPIVFSKDGFVYVHGAKCDVLGAISMDSMVVDLSMCNKPCQVGDAVLFFGEQDSQKRSLLRMAQSLDTIPYELIARLGPRIERIFVEH